MGNPLLCILTAVLLFTHADIVRASDIDIEQVLPFPDRQHQKQVDTAKETLKKAAIKRLQRCWSIAEEQYPDSPIPAPFVRDILSDRQGNALKIAPRDVNPAKMPAVKIYAIINYKGKVVNIAPDAETKKNFENYPGFRLSVNRAMFAIKTCSPFLDLAGSKETELRRVPFTFNPDLMPLDAY